MRNWRMNGILKSLTVMAKLNSCRIRCGTPREERHMCHWKLRSSWSAWLGCSLVLVVSGCRTTSHAQDGALLGAGLGTAVGAIIGAQTGHAEGGAVIGALAGAVTGSIAGDAEDARDDRDAAIAHARYQQEAAYQAARSAVSNLDLIDMTEAHLSDRVIINAVQTRGGQFDLSPAAIIELKRHNVSDEVIMTVQQYNGRGPSSRAIGAPSTVYITPPPPPPSVGIVVAPRPYYGGYYGGGYYGRHGRYGYGARW
jgi:hypothetical protein